MPARTRPPGRLDPVPPMPSKRGTAVNTRTPQDRVRSLSLSVTCLGLALDSAAGRTSPDFLAWHAERLLARLAHVERLGAPAVHGLHSPGTGPAVLELLGSALTVPGTVEGLEDGGAEDLSA